MILLERRAVYRYVLQTMEWQCLSDVVLRGNSIAGVTPGIGDGSHTARDTVSRRPSVALMGTAGLILLPLLTDWQVCLRRWLSE